VADWLARRGAQVLATDVDLSFLQPAAYETRQHDVGTQPAPGEAFDLVHARLLLEHVSARDAALQTMAGALRPGGRLLIESADPLLQPLACPDAIGPAEATANQQRQEALAARAERTDLAYGRTLPRRLRDAGLTDVEAEVCFALGGPAAARLQKTLAGEAGKQVYAAFPVVSAWGRYPGGNCPGGASAGE
jgi:SAM-dependent methyltransferase